MNEGCLFVSILLQKEILKKLRGASFTDNGLLVFCTEEKKSIFKTIVIDGGKPAIQSHQMPAASRRGYHRYVLCQSKGEWCLGEFPVLPTLFHSTASV